MVQKIGNGILIFILTAAVLLGAYLGFIRYVAELGNRSVELAVDLNDLKKIAAFERVPLGIVLDEIRKCGITGIGVFEETLPDAGAQGELYFGRGSGILSLGILPWKGEINPYRTYIYMPDEKIRKRIFKQMKWVLGEKRVNFTSKDILEVDEVEEELRPLGLGISEARQRHLRAKGFHVIPRLWNDPRYHAGNLEAKISGLKEFDLVIFDGEEILGYPDALPALSSALKKHKIKYGYIEIVKQDGDQKLKRLMNETVVRVHSVPRDELKKISREEALDRFLRAVRERNVRLIYLRPFLPPQADSFPVEYNLSYFAELKTRLEKTGYVLGRVSEPPGLKVKGWQVLLLGTGVIVGGLFLLGSYMVIPLWLKHMVVLSGAGLIILLGTSGYTLFLQKILSFLAALIFPSYAVISTFSRPGKNGFFMVANILAETSMGIFLMLGLLADYRFMMGVETFPGVKAVLVLPPLLVAGYFILKGGEGKLKDRLLGYLNTRVSLLSIISGALILGALTVLIARSGNFVLPVPGFEKVFRSWLEAILFVRPRTKEFLIGYPFLYLAAIYYLKGGKNWLWLLAAIGVVAPVSVFNSFSHIHTPVLISLIRSFNGLILGLAAGMLFWTLIKRYIK